MDLLKKKFEEKATALKAEMRAFSKENANVIVDQVKVAQVFGGMRGVKSMIWEASQLDAQEGIRFRGYTIPELKEILPNAPGGKEPLPEGLFSIFSQKYSEGMSKHDYWDATYEDAMNLIAKLPHVAAYIYRRTYHNGEHIAADESLDWAANFAHMLGHDHADFKSLMRLYLTIHADHEGGNASAHTVHLVNSTLSDVYLSFAAGMASLAGPLHGLANQEVIKWIFKMTDQLGTTKPSKEQIAGYVQETLDNGQVIPGYGHAVLRKPDPRFTAQKTFAEEYIQDDDYVNIVWNLFDVVPGILDSLGKVKNPWPNVDAHSGALLVHYGLKEYGYYTVLFGVSRALGVLANSCWSRALGFPLERPKSHTFEKMKEIVKSVS